MRLHDGLGAVPSRSLWRFFPLCLVAGMGVVIAVNSGMVYAALHTFPGLAGNDGFDLSNSYDKVIGRLERQTALGWSALAAVDPAGHPLITLTDRNGVALVVARIDAVAERPVGDPSSRHLRFEPVAPGQYRGDAVLDLKGQWDLEFSVTADAGTLVTTRRLVVR